MTQHRLYMVGLDRVPLTSGCLRRMWRFMEARVDTLVPHRWQDWASTLSWVRCTCFCSMYSVRYFLSHVPQVHVLPTVDGEGQRRVTLVGVMRSFGRNNNVCL